MIIVKTFEQYKDTNEFNMPPIEIDLDNPDSKIKRARKYIWLGVEFIPKLNVGTKSYHAIVSEPGGTGRDANEPFSIVVYGKTLDELKEELQYRIPLFVEDELGHNIEDLKMKNVVSNMEKTLGIEYKDDYEQ